MLDGKRAAGQGRQQIHLGLVVQVIALSLEPRVGLLLDDKDDIAGDDVGPLVALAGKGDLLAVLHALVDRHVQHLALGDGLLAVALLAPVLFPDDLALAVAVWADGLEALDHGAHLAHHRLHAGSAAAVALLHGAFLSATAIALGAQHALLQGELGYLALVEVLETDFVDVDDVSALLGRLGVVSM